LIGIIILLALGVALIGVLLLPGKKPLFVRQDGLRTINCYGSTPGNTVSVPIKVEFQEHGRMAILRFGQDTFRLPFQSNRLFNDYYGNGTIELRLDPEVYLSGLRESKIGPCDLE
jgi:hypothetical protein